MALRSGIPISWLRVGKLWDETDGKIRDGSGAITQVVRTLIYCIGYHMAYRLIDKRASITKIYRTFMITGATCSFGIGDANLSWILFQLNHGEGYLQKQCHPVSTTSRSYPA